MGKTHPQKGKFYRYVTVPFFKSDKLRACEYGLSTSYFDGMYVI
jgi:hypothetical protein